MNRRQLIAGAAGSAAMGPQAAKSALVSLAEAPAGMGVVSNGLCVDQEHPEDPAFEAARRFLDREFSREFERKQMLLEAKHVATRGKKSWSDTFKGHAIIQDKLAAMKRETALRNAWNMKPADVLLEAAKRGFKP